MRTTMKRTQFGPSTSVPSSVPSSRAKRMCEREQRRRRRQTGEDGSWWSRLRQTGEDGFWWSRLRQTEMTEDEMMDVALRRSEEEARVSSVNFEGEEGEEPREEGEEPWEDEEETTVRRFVHHPLAHASARSSRRKPSSPGGRSRRRPQRRGAASPPPDATQWSQAPPRSPGSPQGAGSTQTENRASCGSPVSQSGCRAEVLVDQLDGAVLRSCRTWGFVQWSQDSWTPPRRPRSPAPSGTGGRSPVFGGTARQDEASAFASQELPGSPAPPRSPALPADAPRSPPGGQGPAGDGPSDCSSPLSGSTKTSIHFPSGSPGSAGTVWMDQNMMEDRDRDHGEALEDRDRGEALEDRDRGEALEDRDRGEALEDRDRGEALEDRDRGEALEDRDRGEALEDRDRGEALEDRDRDPQNIHYYWGVPFCPAGLDPDVYTQVILAQLEVQEKCLKQAQRRLLIKAPWGAPVLPRLQERVSPEPPQPAASRLRVRSGQQPDGGRSLEEDEAGGDGGDSQVETDCEVCPETQLSGVSIPELAMDTEDQDKPVGSSPELHLVSRGDSAAGEGGRLEEVEERGGPEVEEVEERGGPEVEEVEERGGPEVEEVEELEAEEAVSPVSRPAVDCPLCRRPFATDRIELHAAYCDGEAGPDPHLHVKVKLRRARRRPAATSDPGHPDRVCVLSVLAVMWWTCGTTMTETETETETERRPGPAAPPSGPSPPSLRPPTACWTSGGSEPRSRPAGGAESEGAELLLL
ncbi:BRCA1-A complex subunit RAP80 isoform X2 [Salarias fasciatus]|uniref:BRCA1-A complex subunit RAP80 isoform X2 n=1 Tax=Salarias fasciatus TaxID=181472 RepID=UPI0011765CF4|nr:BRCA1-A complex subunit RAP80 isoform X2 [Salarias fasciatus]